MSARNPTYPGVYILELPSEVRTIVGVSTSITAFVGPVLKGPRNQPTMIHSFTEFARIFGGLSKDSKLSYMVYHYYLNGGMDAIIVGIDDGSKPARYNLLYHGPSIGEEPAGEWFSSSTGEEWGKFMTFTAQSAGEWGNDFSIVVQKKKITNNSVSKTLVNLFVKNAYTGPEDEKQIKDWLKKSSTLESFYNLSFDSTSSRYIPKVLKNESSFVHVSSDLVELNLPQNELDRTYIFTPYLQKGLAGGKATLKNIIPTDPEEIEQKKGLYALENVDIFNLLVISPYQKNDIGDYDDVDKSVKDFAASYCETRRAIYIVDPLKGWKKKSDVLSESSGIESANFGPSRNKNSAIFFPNIKCRDPLDENRLNEFPPSGVIAGVIARTDTSRGIWKASAGLEAVLRGVDELSIRLTEHENGELNPLGMNCLMFKPPAGIVCWGARTMVGADELADQWKYLSVRRTALYIEESLYRGTQWVVFEPNDERLWSQIRLNVGAFMQDLFAKGAFQGNSPKESYLVKCDKETTTQYDIDKGIVNIIVGFAPLKPTEFVILQIKQLAGSSGPGGV